MNDKIIHDIKNKKFYIRTSSGQAEICYNIEGKVMAVYHTFVSPALRGKGMGFLLGRAIAEKALCDGLSIRPDCWFMKKFLEKNRKYSDLQV